MPFNSCTQGSGDRLEICGPGAFEHTLHVTGHGTAEAPIQIHFAAGRYDWSPVHALQRQYYISNTNGDAEGKKAVALLLDGARHVQITGPEAHIVFRGKTIEACVDGCEDITISDLSFDYHRPTVSEFRVDSIKGEVATIDIHADSRYDITEGQLTWVGEGWRETTGLAQELDLETNEVRRRKDPFLNLHLEEISPFRIRATGGHDMLEGHVYQIRNPFRDYAGVFTRRSKNITWRNVHFRFLHGMGIVNQFSENLTFDTVSIAPDPESGRTTAAWADGIQASGCRGKIIVRNCLFSGAHDDAINIHGTHLRVIEHLSNTQVKVRFMHPQTFGFMAFNPGDEVCFVRSDSLEAYGANTIVDAVLQNPHDMLLTLSSPVHGTIASDDVMENVTWTPEVHISGCKVHRIPTRGFLVTTRRKVIIEDTTFHRTRMNAILVESDAKHWFESGTVLDMTLRRNRFLDCREPVIKINPQNTVENEAAHQNIHIKENSFLLLDSVAVAAHSTRGVWIDGNTVSSPKAVDDSAAMQLSGCRDIHLENNIYDTRSLDADQSQGITL